LYALVTILLIFYLLSSITFSEAEHSRRMSGLYCCSEVMNVPQRPKRPCKHHGCPALVQSGYCEKHKQNTRQYNKYRGSAASRGYGYRWQQYTKVFLREHPLCECEECLEQGRVLPATDVDHRIPVSGSADPLFWDPNNHQALAHECHSRKTARENGGFNNPRK
jgi:5-methylcytosine-specific restriction protein A